MLHLLWHPRLTKQEYDKLNAIKSVCMIVSLRSVRQGHNHNAFSTLDACDKQNSNATRYEQLLGG
jgi:hypothetical protein